MRRYRYPTPAALDDFNAGFQVELCELFRNSIALECSQSTNAAAAGIGFGVRPPGIREEPSRAKAPRKNGCQHPSRNRPDRQPPR